MPDKRTVVKSIEVNKTYTGGQVMSLVDSITVRGTINPPNSLKRGDVYLSNLGGKDRPTVVIKVMKGCVIATSLTSESDSCFTLTPYKSRFFGEGFFSKSLTTATLEYATENFCSVFDSPADLNKACKALKEFYKDIL